MFFKQKKKKQSKNRSQFDSGRGGGTPWGSWDKGTFLSEGTDIFVQTEGTLFFPETENLNFVDF